MQPREAQPLFHSRSKWSVIYKTFNCYVHLKRTVLRTNYSAIERKKQGKEGRGGVGGREGSKHLSTKRLQGSRRGGGGDNVQDDQPGKVSDVQ